MDEAKRIRPREHAPTRSAGLDARLSELEDRCRDQQGALQAARMLASMMQEHQSGVVRLYGNTLLHALEDPDAFEAALAAARSAADPELMLADEPPETPARPPATFATTDPLASLLASWIEVLGIESIGLLTGYLERALAVETDERTSVARLWRCLDWLHRDYGAFWLDQVGRRDAAVHLRALSPLRAEADLDGRLAPVITTLASQLRQQALDLAPGPAAVARAASVVTYADQSDARAGARAVRAATGRAELVIDELTAACRELWALRLVGKPEWEAQALVRFDAAREALRESVLQLIEQLIELAPSR